MIKGGLFFPLGLRGFGQHRSLVIFKVIVEKFNFLLHLFDFFRVLVEDVLANIIGTYKTINLNLMKFY